MGDIHRSLRHLSRRNVIDGFISHGRVHANTGWFGNVGGDTDNRVVDSIDLNVAANGIGIAKIPACKSLVHDADELGVRCITTLNLTT